MPSWGQLKKLTREAEGLVHRTGNKLSSESMFLAMLALMQELSDYQFHGFDPDTRNETLKRYFTPGFVAPIWVGHSFVILLLFKQICLDLLLLLT